MLFLGTACEKQSTDILPDISDALMETDGGIESLKVSLIVIDNFQAGNSEDECAQVCKDCECAFKIDKWNQKHGMDGTYNVDAYGHTITISNSNGNRFDWSSNFTLGHIIVKAGKGANVFVYDPASMSGTDLYGYGNKEISHVTFCWQYSLDVSKTANTYYKRSYFWKFDKHGDKDYLKLSPGQVFPVNFEVNVDAGYYDSDWMVRGDIVISNNTPVAFTVKYVSDKIDFPVEKAELLCSNDLPMVLNPGDFMTCYYKARSLKGGINGINHATVGYVKYKSEEEIRYSMATAPVIFGEPTEYIDECIDVVDDQYGNLGTVCAANTPYTKYNYTMNIGPYDKCGNYLFANTACLTTNDTQAKKFASWFIKVVVPCDG